MGFVLLAPSPQNTPPVLQSMFGLTISPRKASCPGLARPRDNSEKPLNGLQLAGEKRRGADGRLSMGSLRIVLCRIAGSYPLPPPSKLQRSACSFTKPGLWSSWCLWPTLVCLTRCGLLTSGKLYVCSHLLEVMDQGLSEMPTLLSPALVTSLLA